MSNNQDVKESVALNIPSKEADGTKSAEKQKESLETVETKPWEDKNAAPLEEKPVPLAEVISPSNSAGVPHL